MKKSEALVKIAQDLDDLRVLGRFVVVVNVDVTNDALLVHHDDGALGVSLVLLPDAVLPGDFALGMEIGEEGIPGNATERPCKRDVRGDAVHRNAHDLGIMPFKVGHFGLISRHLDGSDRGPVQRVEDQNDILLSARIAEFEFLVAAMTPVSYTHLTLP